MFSGPKPDVDEEMEKEIRKQSFQIIKQQFEAEKEEKENSLVKFEFWQRSYLLILVLSGRCWLTIQTNEHIFFEFSISFPVWL